jgi:hypothetical protein
LPRQNNQFDVAALCLVDLPDQLHQFVQAPISRPDVLSVAFEYFPLPDEASAWQDILEFKAESRDKIWGFRRFLQSLAAKKKTESEVRDEIEWLLNEYKKALDLHNLKTSNGFFEAYVIPAIEIAEDIAKFKWSKIAKGAFSAKKRKVELIEAEIKAPGRECAYVFDARKRFGQRPLR